MDATLGLLCIGDLRKLLKSKLVVYQVVHTIELHQFPGNQNNVNERFLAIAHFVFIRGAVLKTVEE